MRSFFLRLFFFLLPLGLIAVAAETYVRQMPNSYRLKDEWMRCNADYVETIILGNSHAYYGIRPQDLTGRVFNLANVSQIASYDLALLQHYTPMSRLREVILVADNSSLFDPPLEQSEPNRCAYYTIYMGIGPHSRWGRYGLEILQFDGFLEKMKAYKKGTYAMCDSMGWGCNYKSDLSTFNEENAAAAQRAVQRHTCQDWHWVEENAKQVEQIASLCQQKGLRLLVVQTPVCAFYNEGVPAQQHVEVRQLMQKLKKSYGATILDYSADPRFGGKDFFDADHLSDVGAIKFTKILNQVHQSHK